MIRTSHSPAADAGLPASWIVVSGAVALAVAMGIGRFAFTPLMPLMIRDGTLTAATGAEWAAANYGGYLAGALTASWFSGDPRRGVRISLIGIVVTTLAAAWINGEPLALAGAALRAAAGVFSAWAMVCASSWCLAELARQQAPWRGAWIFTGVGSGITLAGLLAWLGGRQSANLLWLELGLIAAAGTTVVGLALRGQATPSVRPLASSAAMRPASRRHLGLVICYGIYGFGYIIPATFLPTMARRLVADPLVFGLTWPLFGLAAILSVTIAAHWMAAWPRRRVWMLAQGVMALGTALPLATHALWALAASAAFVGGTFMVATMAGLQLAREQMPDNPTPLLARMTMAFAVGQIAGPVFVRLIGPGIWAGWDALAWANAVSTGLLIISSVWLWSGETHPHAALEQA